MTMPTDQGDGAPATPPTTGQQDDWKAKYDGLQGAFSQHKRKATTDYEALSATHKTVLEEANGLKAKVETLTTSLKDLEATQKKLSELQGQLELSNSNLAKLKALSKYPELLSQTGEDGNNPYVALVESSVLPVEQLDAQLKALSTVAQAAAQGITERKAATPPAPKKSSDAPTSNSILEEAEALRAVGKFGEWKERMDAYWTQLDVEKGKFVPPQPSDSL